LRDEDTLNDILKRMRDAYCVDASAKSDYEIQSIVRNIMKKSVCDVEPANLPNYGIGGVLFSTAEERDKYVVRENSPNAKTGWQLQSADKVKMEKTEWLWPGFLAKGEISTWSGEVGQGKSLSAIDLGARLSKGAKWPDDTANENTPCATLYISEEESFTHTVKPRWLAAGGDPTMLFRADWNNGDPLRIEQNLQDLSALLKTVQGAPIKYIIFDPLSDFTQKDSLKDQEIRPVLTTLNKWAKEEGVAIVGIMHVNKKNDLSAVQRTSGAKGWVSVPRINNLVGTDANGGKHLVTLKTNIHKSVSAAFHIREAEVTEDGVTVKTPAIDWSVSAAPVTADDLLGAKKTAAKDKARDDASLDVRARGWLRNNLTPEGKLAREVKAQIHKLYGIEERKLIKLAKECGVVFGKTKTVPPESIWSYTLPEGLSIDIGDIGF
jgi:RecA-family ATPase